MCVTGGSAGGHLAALTALSANEPLFQPGFEHVDTSVVAAVPFYGVYDLLDRARIRGSASMTPFLAKQVFKSTPDENPALWDAMSPITRVSESAPPFLVIQGTHDTLVFVEEAREFVRVLRAKSGAAVGYLEMVGAQHAFDMFHSPRSAHAVRAAAAFLRQRAGSSVAVTNAPRHGASCIDYGDRQSTPATGRQATPSEFMRCPVANGTTKGRLRACSRCRSP